ncbi:MAG TPA: hypothetical protein VGV92_04490 [Gammaproteobacteria bacterium]|nr:hypothetical protein [Gammaproteobacteria bacterium]
MSKRKPVAKPFGIIETLREALTLTPGSIGPMLAPIFTMIVISTVLFFIFGFIFNKMNLTESSAHGMWVTAYTLASFFLLLVASLFLIAISGVFMIAIARVRTHQIVQIKTGFQGYTRFIPVILTTALLVILFLLPLFFIALPVIVYALYVLIIGVLFCLSLPLAVDKTNSPLIAIIHSARISSRHFLKIAGIFIILSALFIVACIPLGVGLFFHSMFISILGGIILFLTMLWFTPFKYLVISVIYHSLISKEP